MIVVASASGAALLLWHAVSRTKHVSEQLLATYGRMLAQARDERARKLAEEAEKDPPPKSAGTQPAAPPSPVAQAK